MLNDQHARPTSSSMRIAAFGTSKSPRFLEVGQGFPDPALRTRGPGYRTRTSEERFDFMCKRPATSSGGRMRDQKSLAKRPASAECGQLHSRRSSYGMFESKYSRDHAHIPPTLDGDNSILKLSGADTEDKLQQRRESLVISNRKIVTSTPLKQNQQAVVDAVLNRYRHHSTTSKRKQRFAPQNYFAASYAKDTPGSASDFVAEMTAAESRRGGVHEVLGRLQHWQKLQKDFVGHAPDQGVFSTQGFRRAGAGARKGVRVCNSEREADVASVRALGLGR
jgi:hypothetical protein